MPQPFFYDLHCSLGKERSITDPITNWVMISGIDINRDLVNILQAGKYPFEYLGDFLHETMHHWCFHSPVGLALALLQMRARRNSIMHSMGSLWDDPISLDVIAEDALRYESAIGLLRPLAEGLALFSEFDGFPGDSKIMSMVMNLALLHFTDDENTTLYRFRERLLLHRLSNATRERKANLYVQPLSADDGGYLLGYLFIKNLMFLLQNRTNSDKLSDSDFYMAFMRSFIYDDYGFVAILLDEDKQINPSTMDDKESVQSILRYLNERIYQLANSLTAETLEKFEHAVLAGNANDFWKTTPLGESKSLIEKGQALLNKMYEEIVFSGLPTTLEERLKRKDHWSLIQREYICVGSFRAKVKVNEYHRVSVGEYIPRPEAPLFNAAAFDDVVEGEDEGTIAFFISQNKNISVTTVTRGNEVVHVSSFSKNITEEIIQNIRRFKLNQDTATEEGTLMRTLVEQLLNQTPLYKDYLKYYRDESRRMAFHMFSGQALGATPDSHIEQAKNLLAEKGFYSILSGDQIRILAKLSLAGSIIHRHLWIQESISIEEKTEFDEIMNKLRAKQKEHKIYFFGENADFIVFYV